MAFDVAIVGAGIGGAALALDLGRRGVSVVLVERESAPPRHVRPEILWGATLGALDRLGVGERVRSEASVRLARIDLARRLVFVARDFAGAGTEAFSTDPSTTRAVLVDAALATGQVAIERGVDVRALADEGPSGMRVLGRRADGDVEFRARLVVGDDGARSIVRAHAGIAIETAFFPLDFLTVAIRRPSALPPDEVRGFLDPRAFRAGIPAVAFFPWPGDAGVMLVPLPHARAEELLASDAESFWARMERTTPWAVELRRALVFPRDFTRTRRPFGHADRYVADRLAILGDAAHPMSPVGGQGANAAIADALALADVADEALRARDLGRARLEPYERRRRAANERSVDFTRAAVRAFAVGARLPASFGVPFGLRAVNALPWPKRRLLRTISSAFLDD